MQESNRPRLLARMVLGSLLVLASLALGVTTGCERGDALAAGRGPAAPTSTAETDQRVQDGRQALRSGKALGKIDRLFSSPLGGTKVD